MDFLFKSQATDRVGKNNKLIMWTFSGGKCGNMHHLCGKHTG